MSTNPSEARADNPTLYSDGLVSDASGVLLLLLSAKLSLQTHVAEPACIDSLTKCIGEIRKRYDLRDRDLREVLIWREANIDGLLRLLEYAESEIRERLHDSNAADELRRCARRLATSRQLRQGQDTSLQPIVLPELVPMAPKTTLS